MRSLEVDVQGVGLWSPALPGWPASMPILRGEQAAVLDAALRPSASVLGAAERRRAPETVLLAVEVAQQACAAAGCDPREIPSVFASAYGDLTINDHLCATLAVAPTDLSPTKFHNSVHNAPVGYWAIATGSMHGALALSAGAETFAAGLLEAAVLAQSENIRVLFAAYDMRPSGALTSVIECTQPFAVALLLAPSAGASGTRLRLRTGARQTDQLAPEASLLQAVHRGNPIAASLPLLVALAKGGTHAVALPAGPQLTLYTEISTWAK